MREIDIIQNNTIETQWLNIKSKFKSKDGYDMEELDFLTCDLLAQLAFLTEKGYDKIGGVNIDLYKDRVWNVVENIGLLPEYKDIEVEAKEIIDTWNKVDEDFVGEINDNDFYL